MAIYVIACVAVVSLLGAPATLHLQSVSRSGEVSKRQFAGLIDVFRQILRSDGVPGVYRGFVISCASIALYRGCYFGFFDSLKPVVLQGTLLFV